MKASSKIPRSQRGKLYRVKVKRLPLEQWRKKYEKFLAQF